MIRCLTSLPWIAGTFTKEPPPPAMFQEEEVVSGHPVMPCQVTFYLTPLTPYDAVFNLCHDVYLGPPTFSAPSDVMPPRSVLNVLSRTYPLM